MDISKIEDIYKEYNIHKAIIVCNKEDIDDYHKALVDKDHSIIRSEHVHLLNDIENRVLLIDIESAIESFKHPTSLVFEWITIVIYINTAYRVDALNQIPTIIL
jgi:hypothetical protein